MSDSPNSRILLIDDNEAIHEDFKKILGGSEPKPKSDKGARSAFFGEEEEESAATMSSFELTSAYQGDEALELVKKSVEEGRPFAMAFVDVRMPPGWDGVETIERLWQVDPQLNAVICTAYADYSWSEMVAKLGQSDRLLILKKPFDPVEVCQLASAVTAKWNATKQALDHTANLERANHDLYEARTRAEAASRAKSEFLANMSHEIRTPMTAILGYADLLRDADLSVGEVSGHVDTICRNGEHLLAILNDILDISRIEAGRMEIEPVQCSPYAILSGVASLMKGRADEAGLQLHVEWEGAIPEFIESDPTRLRQILLNLVGNAIKFTETGSVTVRAGVKPGAGGQNVMQFDVVDTGIGIEAEAQGALFEAFNQADTSSTRRAGGTGLGLTISRRLAQILGGDISFVSEAGAGSTFTLTIAPGNLNGVRMLDHTSGSPRVHRVEEPGEADAPQLRGRVLIVDDSESDRQLVCSYLTKAGLEVLEACDGFTACDMALESLAAGTPYDLILMDMGIPVMDGYEATSRIRSGGYSGRIMALTARAMVGDREKCLQAGCDDYASKPIERDKLIEACRRQLTQASPPSPLPSNQPGTSADQPNS